MVRAHVLVECQSGQIAQALKALRALEGIDQAEATLGPHDVVMVVQKKNLEELGDFVVEKIQTVPGVKGTITCLHVRL